MSRKHAIDRKKVHQTYVTVDRNVLSNLSKHINFMFFFQWIIKLLSFTSLAVKINMLIELCGSKREPHFKQMYNISTELNKSSFQKIDFHYFVSGMKLYFSVLQKKCNFQIFKVRKSENNQRLRKSVIRRKTHFMPLQLAEVVVQREKWESKLITILPVFPSHFITL